MTETREQAAFSHASTLLHRVWWCYRPLRAVPPYPKEQDTHHPLDLVVQPGLPTPTWKFFNCYSKISHESDEM